MGLLIDGEWHDRWYDTNEHGGRFKRQEQAFRHWITPDGAPGPSGDGGFPAEAGRYHLYVSYACPWAHPKLTFRALKGLQSMIDVSVVHWHMAEHGWTFQPGEGVTGDKLMGHALLRDVYLAAEPTRQAETSYAVFCLKKKNGHFHKYFSSGVIITSYQHNEWVFPVCILAHAVPTNSCRLDLYERRDRIGLKI